MTGITLVDPGTMVRSFILWYNLLNSGTTLKYYKCSEIQNNSRIHNNTGFCSYPGIHA